MIKKLSKEVWSKIQAGEVIDGPAAIIRELIDNSLDAKSQNINLFVDESDSFSIVLDDDGEGILYDDSFLLFTNHTTSKIDNFEDLERLDSMGFRGEALFSIGNISYVNLKSRNLKDQTGFEIIIHGGKKILHQKIQFSKGTKISVNQIFFNVPVREKFMKEYSKELQNIKQVFIDKSLANYDITFNFNSGKKEIYRFFEQNNLLERVKQVYPNLNIEQSSILNIDDFKKIKNSFIEKYQVEKINLICSNRNSYLKNRSILHFSFNRRSTIVENLLKRIRVFYSNYLPRGFYPFFFLEIKLLPSLLDFNIHPAKKNIKIYDEDNFINDLIFVLNKKLSESQFIIRDENFISSSQDYNKEMFETNLVKDNKDNNLFFEKQIIDELNFEENFEERNLISFLNGKFLGLLFNTYLLFENQERLLIVDQHAADERITYNLLIKNVMKKKRVLLFPKIFEVNNNSSDVEINRIIENFGKAGIEISFLNRHQFQIFSIPDIVPTLDEENFLKEVINFIDEVNYDKFNDIDSIDSFVSLFYNHIIEKSACHLAIKQNDILTEREARNLCKDLFKQKDYLKCPHGRPTLFIIDKENFEKTFLRKK